MSQNRKKARQKRKRYWRMRSQPGADHEYGYHVTRPDGSVVHCFNHASATYIAQQAGMVRYRGNVKRVYRGWGAPEFTLRQSYAESVVHDGVIRRSGRNL